MPTAPSRGSLGSVNNIIWLQKECGREIRTQILGMEVNVYCHRSYNPSSPLRYELARATRLELSFLY